MLVPGEGLVMAQLSGKKFKNRKSPFFVREIRGGLEKFNEALKRG
jgi:hypothetical protein